jgi:hypothetical protein
MPRTNADNPLVLNERTATGKKCLRRGIALYQKLVDLANNGEAVGVSYSQFVCLLHGVQHYEDAVGRKYFRADTPPILRLSAQVTDAGGGRVPLTWNGVTILAGMDAFIWRQGKPFPRPRSAFSCGPYTETEWKKVFPDGYRRLLRADEWTARVR